MKKKSFKATLLISIFASLLILNYYKYKSSAVLNNLKPTNDKSASYIFHSHINTDTNVSKIEAEQKYTSTPISEVSLISVGDIMFHMPEVIACKEGNSFNFKPMFADIKNIISSKDIAVGNLETTINPRKMISGYPVFNSPVQVLDALKDTGFDILLTNNNHIFDTGIEGIKSTNRLVNKYGIKSVGSGEKEEERFTIIEKNNIRIGMLAYTYGTNFGKPYKEIINYIDEEKIKKDLNKIKKECDFTIVYLHIGTEYVRSVEPSQAEIIDKIVHAGADAIICSHPHVSRESELVTVNGKKIYINYSMGNFISNQSEKYTDIGSMACLTIEKSAAGTQLKSAETIPVYRLKYTIGSKTIYKTVLFEKINMYKSILSKSTLAYINKVSSGLAYKYIYNGLQNTNK